MEGTPSVAAGLEAIATTLKRGFKKLGKRLKSIDDSLTGIATHVEAIDPSAAATDVGVIEECLMELTELLAVPSKDRKEVQADLNSKRKRKMDEAEERRNHLFGPSPTPTPAQ